MGVRGECQGVAGHLGEGMGWQVHLSEGMGWQGTWARAWASASSAKYDRLSASSALFSVCDQ